MNISFLQNPTNKKELTMRAMVPDNDPMGNLETVVRILNYKKKQGMLKSRPTIKTFRTIRRGTPTISIKSENRIKLISIVFFRTTRTFRIFDGREKVRNFENKNRLVDYLIEVMGI